MKFVIFGRNFVLVHRLLINYNDANRGAFSTTSSLVAPQQLILAYRRKDGSIRF